jgi:hypothetical protein
MRKKRKRWRGNEGATGEGEEGGKEKDLYIKLVMVKITTKPTALERENAELLKGILRKKTLAN